MNLAKRKYDFILPLGGSCAAARNLIRRNLRLCSFPFDWAFFISDYTIYKLSECFKNNFKDFLLKENLVELLADERGSDHGGKMQYKDTYTEFRWVNHFVHDINDKRYNSYNDVKIKINRRIKRIYDLIDKSENVLLLMCTTFELEIDSIKLLKETLNELYPHKNFDFEVVSFSCKQNETVVDSNITIHKYTRAINSYDFSQTNYEWAFLDDIQINRKLFDKNNKFIIIKPAKNGFNVYLLTFLPTICRIKLYLLKLRIDFCLGKVRDVFYSST